MSDRTPLEVIQIKQPCELDWDALPGDGPTRMCPRCRKQVHNLSALPREDAERLVGQRSGPMCVYFTRDPHGIVNTLEYAPGPNRTRQRWWFGLAGVLTLVGAGCQFLLSGSRPPSARVAGTMPFPASNPAVRVAGDIGPSNCATSRPASTQSTSEAAAVSTHDQPAVSRSGEE